MCGDQRGKRWPRPLGKSNTSQLVTVSCTILARGVPMISRKATTREHAQRERRQRGAGGEPPSAISAIGRSGSGNRMSPRGSTRETDPKAFSQSYRDVRVHMASFDLARCPHVVRSRGGQQRCGRCGRERRS